MAEWTRKVTSGEPINSNSPLTSAARANLLTQVARREIGIGPPQDGKPRPASSAAAAPDPGPASCGEIEISTAGGLHFRLRCDDVITPWVTIPASYCDDGIETAAVYPPS